MIEMIFVAIFAAVILSLSDSVLWYQTDSSLLILSIETGNEPYGDGHSPYDNEPQYHSNQND